ncbi:MFS transporter [Fredinandcohnia quinoae]|uniref:MFS transporter n=1 Tax=Fredinandcohnia quinoae TaxID=2918902 RepID=A0AAW5E5M8_9BACI|nr:MFS transporter [Fredinandcohnia sp. SECRCQ15]MCH1627803.1 MFS transporter [Fredinandcohnia sp. SECRCQ15]
MLAARTQSKSTKSGEQKTIYSILFIIGLCHMLNDSIQAVIPAMFPILKKSMGLTFTQLGLISFALQVVSSVMQPAIGWYTDKKQMPFALPTGLTFTFLGVIGLAFAPSYTMIIISVLFIGIGSAIFHPEGSRVAYMAAGSRRGLAQSIYQVGGNSGQALAPVITALILVPLGQFGAIWFSLVAALAIILLVYIARWYSETLQTVAKQPKTLTDISNPSKNSKAITLALIMIVFLVFARSWYMSCITNFYSFYVMDNYQLTVSQAQVYIFLFLATGALGTFFGGPLADRYGKRNVILVSLLGSAPLAIILPFVGPIFAYIILAIIGFVLMSSFSVTVVYAQELLPGKIGMMSGLTVGLAFGMGAIGSIAIGSIADIVGLTPTIIAIGFLPLLGFLTFLLPSDQKLEEWYGTNIE